MYIKMAMIRGGKSPVRSNRSDAGLDVHWNPSHETVMDNGGPKLIIKPGQSVVLETALKFEIPHGYMLQVANRGSMGAKKNLIFGAHIIDSGYSGEVFINLHNIGDVKQEIKAGDKIAQLIMTPIITFDPIIVLDEKELYSDPVTISGRGDGKLGSTGS